jgi:glucose-1-phosphate cytidylyltransferase
MKVVLLCGGLGTRLREETEFRPKPLVDVGGRPILWHIMKIFAHHGLRDFVVCLGYRGSLIKEYFLNYEAMNNDFSICLGRNGWLETHGAHEEQDFRVTLAETGEHSQTGGRVRRVSRYLDGDTFLVTYGDGVADVDVSALLKFHRRHGRLATVTTVRPISRFGLLDVGGSGAVRDFSEKPQVEGWINAGFFVFERRVLDYLEGDDCVLEQGPLARLAREGQLMAWRHHGFFFAMDTYREYKALNELWSSGKAPWKMWA